VPSRPESGPGKVGPERPDGFSALSVDVEDYYQVQAFADLAPRDTWDRHPSRVEANTRRLLDRFDEWGARGTFFTLGWIARRYPALVQEIVSRGHELASHGMDHRMLTEQDPASFRSDALDSRLLLEDVGGVAVVGFRAPSYSVNRTTLWAIDVLAEAGYAYDSSVYPIRRRRYGYPEGPVLPAAMRGERRSLVEFPLPTWGAGAIRLPVLAGAYLRLLPAWVSTMVARGFLESRTPFVVNVHPWEIDPGQPTLGGSRWRTWTHYARLERTEEILGRVLRMGRFRSVADRLRDLGFLAGSRVEAAS
jgi:polysaccharide deacetylase family protein (PEP-CTERM system associated)